MEITPDGHSPDVCMLQWSKPGEHAVLESLEHGAVCIWCEHVGLGAIMRKALHRPRSMLKVQPKIDLSVHSAYPVCRVSLDDMDPFKTKQALQLLLATFQKGPSGLSPRSLCSPQKQT
jgi:hypothetical protein